jgi:hypothetical protein
MGTLRLVTGRPTREGRAAMEIQITTFDNHIDFDLVQKDSVSIPETIELGSGVTVVHRGTYFRKGADFPVIVTLAVAVAGSIAISVAANAVYDFLKSRVKKPVVSITIDRTRVEFEEGAIKQIVTERITGERVE